MTIIKYGDKVHILNGYNGWKGGYLDTNGNSPDGDTYAVSTNANPARDASGTGTWVLVCPSKRPGSSVVSGDVIYLKNMYGAGDGSGPGSYLDSINHAASLPDKYKVETSTLTHRDGGSGSWQLQAQSSNPADGKVRYGDIVQFINLYGANGGYLDTDGISSAGSGAEYAVVTSYYSDRAGQSTASWRIQPAA